MKIAIIGSGAMGSLFGGRLALAGHQVLLYDVFKDHVDAVREKGLAIEDAAGGETLVARPEASCEASSVKGYEILVVFVKSTSTDEAAARFATLADPGSIVLTLQNGLGNEEIIRKHFGAARTAAGVTSQGATFLGPGRIRHAGKGPTHLCMADGNSARLAPLAAALSEAGFETHIEADVASLVWSKLVINVGINALTAIAGKPNGWLLEDEGMLAVMADLVAEAAAVAKARGVRLGYDDPIATVREVSRKTGANRSSMLQDFDRNRPTEIDFMNGAIVREAAKLGIPVPVNATITRLIHAMEKARQP